MTTEHVSPATGTGSPAPALTADDPLVRRLAAWAGTRFPAPVVVLLGAMFLGAILVGSAATGARPMAVGPLDLLGFVAFVLFAFGLRVYDEHKDFETDQRLHPDRLTVTGVMPLRDLRRVHAVGLVVQLGTCLLFDRGVGAVTISWLVATAWSLLMLREFFVGEWLSAHPILYSVSHAVAMPLVMIWAVAMGARGAVFGAPVWWLSGLAVASAFGLELARKLASPDDERPEIQTYTQIFGLPLACAIGIGLVVADMVSLVALISVTTGSIPVWVAVVVVALFLLGALPFVRFVMQPSTKTAEVPELGTALVVLGSFVVLITALIIERGIAWR